MENVAPMIVDFGHFRYNEIILKGYFCGIALDKL